MENMGNLSASLPFLTTSSTTQSVVSYSIILVVVLIVIRRWRRNRLLPPSPVSLPVIGHLHLLGPLVHQSFQHMSFIYGPLFTLKLGSVRGVVVSSPEVAREFLQTSKHTFSNRKQSAAIKRLTHESGIAFVPYGPYWKFINKLAMNNLLNPKNLSQFLPIRNEELHHFLRLLKDRSLVGSSVNVTKELLKLTNNIISHMIFGIRCSDNIEGRADEAMALVREVTQIFGEFNLSDFVWLGKGLECFLGYNGRVEDIHRRYDHLLESIIMEREDLRSKRENKLEDNDHVRDFLDILLDAMDDEGSEIKVTRTIIKALIVDFLTAGTDTTAISIDWALVELINNPRILKKAQEEIDRVVGRDRIVQETDVANLPHIQAIIKETYRLHPPVPMLIRKSTQGCTVNGYQIPKDTVLFVNIWAIGRDPKCWESPLEYRPERFMQQPSSGGSSLFMDLKGRNFEMLPFGTGRRGCPGFNLAMQFVPTALAALVQCFDWKMINGGIDGSDRLDMSERPGITAPRAHDLISVPVQRFDLSF